MMRYLRSDARAKALASAGLMWSSLLLLSMAAPSQAAWRSPAHSGPGPGVVPAGVNSITGTWAQLPPPELTESAAVYDPVRQRVLVFGGEFEGTLGNDLWELTLTGTPHWTKLTTSGARPAARSSHGMLYDSRRDQLLLFGGRGAGDAALNDIWALPLGTLPLTWSQGSPTGTPPAPRAYFSGVYDSTGDRVILFGGALTVSNNGPPSNFVDDVWVLPMNAPPAWTQITPAGTPPSPRAGALAIWDKARNRMIVQSGFDGGVLGGTWSLAMSPSPQWTQLSPTGGPPDPRAIAAGVYDPPNDRMVMYGGIGGAQVDQTLTDVWSLSLASPAWTQLTPGGGTPTTPDFPLGVYDLQRRQMIAHAGRDHDGNWRGDATWGLSLDGAPMLSPIAPGPSMRYQAAGSFDPTPGRLVVYGGTDGTNTLSDTWLLSVDATPHWTTVGGATPGARTGHSAIYDTQRDRLVIFGGRQGVTGYQDAWALSLGGSPAWSQITTSGTPPAARSLHSAIYDWRRDRMIVYGGVSTTGTYYADAWALDLSTNAWSQLHDGTGGPPTPRIQHAAVFDDRNDRMLVFSGQGQSNELWALSLSGAPGWANITPFGASPGARFGATAVYDTTVDAMLFYGGRWSGGGEANDTWILLLRNSPSWEQMSVGSPVPSWRGEAVGGYDQAGARMVLAGGSQSGWECYADAWVLTFDQATPVQSTLVSATGGIGRVDLVWWLADAAADIGLERRTGNQPWTRIATLRADAPGRLEFTDTAVAAGGRYGYRLVTPDGAGTSTSAAVWVDVPLATGFGLVGFVPNPASGEVGLSFTLGSAGPASIEVMDIGGRRVFVREVGSMGPGRHTVALDRGRMPAGVYLIRMVGSGDAMERKAVLIR